jgi:hypothetical protein
MQLLSQYVSDFGKTRKSEQERNASKVSPPVVVDKKLG